MRKTFNLTDTISKVNKTRNKNIKQHNTNRNNDTIHTKPFLKRIERKGKHSIAGSDSEKVKHI